MQITRILQVALLFVGVDSRVQRRHFVHKGSKANLVSSDHGDTKKYIVEFTQGSALEGITHQLASRPDQHGTTYKAFDCSDIFHGVSIETDVDNVDSLRMMEGVANVWPMKSVPVEKLVKPRAQLDLKSRLLNYSMHQWTGVNTLHSQGIRGMGAKVAIIDTGIDYTHNALGGCFGPGCKVSGGYDLVGAQWDAHDEAHFPKRPDADPMDYYGHGTHVAGIIAGKSSWFTGVAPDAELLIYKVFADDPWETDEETLIQSFCDAYGAGADVISASIGQPDGFSDNPWALVASRLVDRGVVVTIAAGNEGITGPFYSSSGSNGPGVLSVAAINVTGNPNISVSNPSAKPMPAFFTTWGPTNELLIKPDVGAPGYDVISTVPKQQYELMSGTSMAAPYIAGVAALYIGKYGGRSIHGADFAKTLGQRIIASGKTVAWAAAETYLNQTAPPFQVGTGLVDAMKVLHYDTQLDFEPFALLDTELFRPHWSANISHFANTTVNYTFSIEPAPAFNILDQIAGIHSLFDIQPISVVPRVHLPRDVTVPPGETHTAHFHFESPQGVDDDYLPLYGGKIIIEGSNGERLAIPYGGAAYDTEKAFDTMFSNDPVVLDADEDFVWSFSPARDRSGYVTLSGRLSYPCTNLRWDIFDSYWQESFWELPLKIGLNGFVGSATTMRDADEFWYYDPKVMDKNDTVAFPMLRVPRTYFQFWWFGKLANGTQIAPGNYTMRFAALRPYGNPNITDHWDIMKTSSPTFQVIPYSNHSVNSTTSFHRGRI
ncbi:subtilase family protein [Sarocladium implicatum]|nr:subtilase family protein [Sarocladium implicatum]